MASRNGLNPKIRGSKGKGFGRALPAAFGFDNGLKPNGTAMYFLVPGMLGKYINTSITFEIWCKAASVFNYTLAGMHWTGIIGGNSRFNMDARDWNEFGYPTSGTKHLLKYFDLDNGKSGLIQNADPIGYRLGDLASFTSQIPSYPVNDFTVNIEYSRSEVNIYPIDEFRVYNKVLPLNEVVTNYNNGMGANPTTTENLLIWYKFETFELLDFSSLQDGSDIRLGMRDFSGNNNHGLPINMDTNSASSTYSLQPF
ncbi:MULTISPECIES: hypothetical protein [unclassified Mucilaginibacter]|uniref:hypothetical protein n=1 Tax=unclassified Mucilaginibacter TaxID=2617802 RepID=UPI002AC9DF98|nr:MULTISPECIES: hypothetical protein [unclassified Mucilaginibacter]MEB0280618.1 hypothetical protein [Mucilaginibacter sp. 10B2]MEB0300291.1 hypothetical protein [Mucilaginibacter sp. 5C4]WPX24964.1 hypothetical protein RHM67_06775 [Mucilaginibacter sp. 5C4]